jgi:hypothetical protein
MDIELCRSWCLELPEAENDFSVKKEIFAINQKTFAFIQNETISLKCEPVASLAILADNNPNCRPSKYSEELWGCQKTFVFPTIKLLDYKKNWEELEKSDNPFAVVVMTHLKMLETKNDKLQRLDWKIDLTKNLYGKGCTQEQIFALFTFIDWLLILPGNLTIAYNKAISNLSEETKMRYLTTPEQIGRKEGRKEGRNEEKFYIAKKMKKQGFDTPVIKDLTGLKDKDLKSI